MCRLLDTCGLPYGGKVHCDLVMGVPGGMPGTADALVAGTIVQLIEAFDARVAQDTRTLMVRGRLPNADHRLLPGMFANVAVLEGKPTELVTVPRTAVTCSCSRRAGVRSPPPERARPG